MRLVRRLGGVAVLLAATVAAGCGNDGPGDPEPFTPSPAPSYSVQLQSDAGDYIGGGRSYAYTPANSVMIVTANGNRLNLRVAGADEWLGEFQLPSSLGSIQPGSYTNLQRYPFHDPAAGGLEWTAEHRGCNQLSGSFTIDRATYTSGKLTAVELRFEQHCEGMAPALRGTVRWSM